MAMDFAATAITDLEDLLATAARTVPASPRHRKRGDRYSPRNEGWVPIPGAQEIRFARSISFTRWEAHKGIINHLYD